MAILYKGTWCECTFRNQWSSQVEDGEQALEQQRQVQPVIAVLGAVRAGSRRTWRPFQRGMKCRLLPPLGWVQT
eukprot:scaffold72742_cov60-Phaeocystis_antarctica.AAC.1